MPDDELLGQMQQLSRQSLRLIWEMSGLDETVLNDEDRVLLEMMRMHPEYYDLWGRLDEVSDEELERDGTNSILHILIHQTVENQIAAGTPPETARILERLISQGITRHEAIHQIGAVVAEEIFDMMKTQRVFDERNYVKKLRRLGAPRQKSKRHRRRGS